MLFQRIAIAGGQADTANPRTNPADVLASLIKPTPPTLTSTDQAPTVTVFALEGTATQTVTVQMFALDEGVEAQAPFPDAPSNVNASRRFYAVAASFVVTVGTLAYARALPGKVYYRLTSAPAADAVLNVGFAAGSPT